MESLVVTTENLIQKAGKIDEEATTYYNNYRELLSQVDTFTSSVWTGEDAKAFRDRVYGFEDDFRKMKELMNEYAQFLKDAASTYENTQKDVINKINALQN